MMMIPRKRSDLDLFEEMFHDPFFSRREEKLMRTDIKEKGNNYVIEMDLPGYEKEDIKIKMEKGYLTVTAKVNKEINDDKEENYIHRERYSGECSRSFYVGENVKEDEVKASFKNGTLKLVVLKKDQKELDNGDNYIPIE